jgi:hypothetical protein
VGLKLNGTYQLLVYADGVTLLRDSIEERIESLIDSSNEVSLEVNVEKTKYMLLSCHQNAGQNHDIKTASRSFESMVNFIYLGTTITNQNLINEEVKNRLIIGNFCHHSVNIFYSCLL